MTGAMQLVVQDRVVNDFVFLTGAFVIQANDMSRYALPSAGALIITRFAPAFRCGATFS